MRHKLLGLALCGVLALAATVNAATIGVNFAESAGHANQQLDPATEAGVWSTYNWNNTAGASGTASNLVDSAGTTNITSITWSSSNVWGDGAAQTDATAGIGNAQIARGYVDDGDTGGGIGLTFTVTDIPYTTYTAVLLLSTGADGSTYMPFEVNGGSYSTEGTKRRYEAPFQWDTNTCIVVTNLTGDLVVSAPSRHSDGDGNTRSSTGGFQIIDEATEGPQPPFTWPLPPVWDEDPMTGNDGLVDLGYVGTLADKVSDANGDIITYSITNGPAWLAVHPTDGTLSGTPLAGDAGSNVFTVVATTDPDGSIEATLNVWVVASAEPTKSVIAWNFAGRHPNRAVQGDGEIFGTDEWTDNLDYAAAPWWYAPANSTDEFAVTTPISATMVSVAWSSSGTYTAGNDATLEEQLFKVYLDDGGDGPMITVSGLSTWMATQGALGYKVTFYQNSDAANNTFPVMNIYEGTNTTGTLLEALPPTLTDGSGSGGGSRLIRNATGSFTADTVTFHTDRDLGGTGRAAISGFTITTLLPPQPPEWKEDPTWGDNAFSTVAYNGTLEGKATDPNDDPIVYTLVDVGTWLSVATNGVMTGTPAPSDIGTNTFTVTATANGDSVDGELKIVVEDFSAEPIIAWNFTANWTNTTIQGETVDGTDRWTDSVDVAAPEGTTTGSSAVQWAVTTPISASQVTVEWGSSGMWQGGAFSDPEQQLHYYYLDDNGGDPTITISGLDDWMASLGVADYQIEIYRSGGGESNNFAQIDIHEGVGTGGTLLESLSPEVAAGGGNYPIGTDGGSPGRLKQTAASAFTAGTVTLYTSWGLGGGERSGIAGFKITADTASFPGGPAENVGISGAIANEMVISWTGTDGKPYGVETNSNLIISDGWALWEGGVIAVDGEISAVTNIVEEDELFYRVVPETP